jgi:hypothetical protein
MSAHDASPSTPSSIKVNTTVEDRPALVVGSGYLAILIAFAFVVLAGGIAYSAISQPSSHDVQYPVLTLFGIVCCLGIAALICISIYSLQPNESAVVTLFGSYAGTDSTPGLRATVPLFRPKKVSQRIRYHECGKLKVNDLIGNPIEIGAVVVWRVVDCAKATFQIDNYADFVGAQTESALRHIAGRHPYDFDEAGGHPGSDDGAKSAAGRTLSLRESGDKLVVSGAVDIVKEALEKLKEATDIDLDPERKASMVSNLLVVLVSDKDATPVINTGTLYA